MKSYILSNKSIYDEGIEMRRSNRRKPRQNRLSHRVRGQGEFPANGEIGGAGFLSRDSARVRQHLQEWAKNWNRRMSGSDPTYAT